MSIYFGNDTVNVLYIGLTPVTKGYVGTHLFYNGDNTIIDLTYEKYILNTKYNTLYNTEEAPVKSAILKGQTLVNDVNLKRIGLSSGNTLSSDGYITITANSSFSNAFVGCKKVKPNTKYLCIVDIKEYTANGPFSLTSKSSESVFNVSTTINSGETGIKKFVLTSNDTIDGSVVYYSFRSYLNSLSTNGHIKYRVMMIEYQDGMEKWDIPYFEGMQSVKIPVLTTTGKNLFDGGIERGSYSATTTNKVSSSDNTRCRSSVVSVIPDGIKCRATINKGFQFYLRLFKDGKVVKESGFCTFYNLDNTSNTFSEITIVIKKSDNTAFTDDDITTVAIQIEEGSVGTEYEPYKSNILTVNEPVKLLGLGAVKDELDLLTGELTQRIGDITFDGSEDWKLLASNSNDYRTVFIIPRGNIPTAGNIVSIEYPSYSRLQGTEECGYIYVGGSNLNIVEEANMSLDAFKSKLQSNPINIQYLLPSESVKTVDLSVTDQNGNVTKLSTFNDITHVTLSSEGLIPEAELEAATKNEEALNTMSLEMDDISATQTTLDETSNIQSENVDSTMVATTEIYEQLI